MTALHVCMYCGEPVIYRPARGWTHLDGALVRTRRMTPAEVVRFERNRGREPGPMEMYLDDHVAMPVPVAAIRESEGRDDA